ncbi:MAG: hypothetical protein J6Y08_04760 [Clostridiales bacterium]|nr:hypothetical protein [Clostridiales bacterium]
MDTTLTIRAVVTLGFLVICIVLLFIGLRLCIKQMQKDEGTGVLTKDILIRSTLILLGSILAMTVSYSAMHYPDIVGTDSTMTELVLASFVFVLKAYGWIIAIPFLMHLFRRGSGPRTNDTDKM